MKKILGFNLDTNTKNILSVLNIDVIDIDKSLHNKTISYLLKDNTPINNPINYLTINEPMIIFAYFSNEELNNTLKLLKTNNAPSILKAIVTDTNINWPANVLYQELIKEANALK